MPHMNIGLKVLRALLGAILTIFSTVAVPGLKLMSLRRPLLLLAALSTSACHAVKTVARAIVLNDVHSRLNPTAVASITAPQSTAELVDVIRTAQRQGRRVSISAGRHAMGGQQFGAETFHISMSRMDDVLAFDRGATRLAKAQRNFQRIIDRALELGGSYYLTYHRWARKDQVLRAYPQFPEFLRWKRQFDPSEQFQSDWYRHYKAMFSQELAVDPTTEPVALVA